MYTVYWQIVFVYLKDFIHLFMRDRHRQREKQAPSGEPDAELEPRTPGSQPEPKADAQPLSHPGAPTLEVLILLTFQTEAETQDNGDPTTNLSP